MENEEMNEIKKLIKEKPLIIKYQIQISNSINEVKSEYFDDFYGKLREEFKQSNKPLILENKKYTQRDRYEQYIIKNRQYDNLYFLLEYDNSINSLYIGLRTEKPTPPNIVKKYKTLTNELREIYNNASANYNCKIRNEWLAGYFIIYDKDFINFNFSLTYELEEKVKKTAEKISEYLDYMTKELNEIID